MVPPVPFPNTEVKRLSADDTGKETFWENMPPPGVIKMGLQQVTLSFKPITKIYSDSDYSPQPLTYLYKSHIIEFRIETDLTLRMLNRISK